MSSSDNQAVVNSGKRDPAIRRAQAKAVALATRVKSGVVGSMWSRLNAVDFMNSSMQAAALILLCLFPIMVVIAVVAGRDVRHTIIIRLGLNAQAAKDVDGLISSGHQAVQTLTVLGCIFLVLSAVAIASTLQTWYEKVFDEPPAEGWKKPLVYRLVWFVTLGLNAWALVLVGSHASAVGGPVVAYLVEFVISTLFWWWSMWMLLLGRRGWRILFPRAPAPSFCLAGLGVFSALLFSSTVVSDEKSYGPIGVIMVLLSYCIGFGVCLHLGAVIGRMWNDRHQGTRVVQVEALSNEGARE